MDSPRFISRFNKDSVLTLSESETENEPATHQIFDPGKSAFFRSSKWL